MADTDSLDNALAELDALTKSPYSDPTYYRDDYETVAAELRGLRSQLAESQRENTGKCDCYPSGFNPETYDGVKEDCPEHGRRADECVDCLHRWHHHGLNGCLAPACRCTEPPS